MTSRSIDHLGKEMRRGFSWNLAGALTVNGMRILVLIVLGRALSSADFGIVAAAVSVNTIVYSIRDIGIGPALIQRKQLDKGHLTTAFAVSMYLGILISAGLFIAAPWIGLAFGITESIDVIRALAVLFVLRNAASTSRMICRREMNFRLIAIVDAGSFSLGSLVSIIAALMGGGPWALVAGYLVEEILATLLFLFYSPPPFSLRVNRYRLRELLSFGVGQTVTQIGNIGAMYGDNVVVGHALGAAPLGFYSRAYDLIKFPAMVFDAIVANVLFPAFSRIQDDRENLAAGFRRGTFVNALVLFPASALLAVLGPEVIRILVGPGWDDAVLPFQILAITVVLRSNQKLGVLVAQAAGAVNAVAIAVVVYMLAVVGGAAFSVRWGIPGVAATTMIAILIVSVESAYLAIRVSGLSLRALLAAYIPGLALALLTMAVGWPLAVIMRGAGVATPLVAVGVSLAGMITCFAATALWLIRPKGDFVWLAEEVRRIWNRFQRRTPAHGPASSR